MMRVAWVVVLVTGLAGGVAGCDFKLETSSGGQGGAGGEQAAAGSSDATAEGEPARATSAPAAHPATRVATARPAGSSSAAASGSKRAPGSAAPAAQGGSQASAGAESQPASGGAGGGGAQASADEIESCFAMGDEPVCSEQELRKGLEELARMVERVDELPNTSEYTVSEVSTPDIDEIRAKLVKQQEVLATMAPVQAAFARFAARYLAEREQDESLWRAMDRRFRALDSGASSRWSKVSDMVERMEGLPAKNAKQCLGKPVMEMRAIDVRHEMYRVKLLTEAVVALELCPRFDPGSSEIADEAERLRPQVTEMLGRYASRSSRPSASASGRARSVGSRPAARPRSRAPVAPSCAAIVSGPQRPRAPAAYPYTPAAAAIVVPTRKAWGTV